VVKLGVNIDHVATLRQQRKQSIPDPVKAALAAQRSGADSIVAHLREDRRHIQESDIKNLKHLLRIPLAMEMAATDEMVAIACAVRPQRVCLVPEKRQELTTEGGLNLFHHPQKLKKQMARLARVGIEVSLFIDPEIDQIYEAKMLNADIVEFHTGRYAQAIKTTQKIELNKLIKAALVARALGLRLHAGHGLDYKNVKAVARISDMEELNIGFSIISEAVFSGIAPAVRRMKTRMA